MPGFAPATRHKTHPASLEAARAAFRPTRTHAQEPVRNDRPQNRSNQSLLRLLATAKPASRAALPAFSLQAKLEVGASNDAFEQQADSIAARVMRTPEPRLQRACACGGTCSACKAGHHQDEPSTIQAKPLQPGSTAGTQPPANLQQVLAQPGQPLSPSVRLFMEPRFGHSFSHVRTHSGPEAAQSAAAIRARAYTVGHNIVFSGSQHQASTPQDKFLVAHELAHTLQQSSGTLRLQRYDESTEPPSRAWEFIKDFALGPLIRPLINYSCLTDLSGGTENPMADLTFNRWIPHACSRIPNGFLHSRQWDAFGHCWIGCEGTRKCGQLPTYILGTGREYKREYYDTQPHDSFDQDRHNQATGRNIAYTPGTCYALCDGAALDLTAPEGTCINCADQGAGEGPCPAAPAAAPVAAPAAPSTPAGGTGGASGGSGAGSGGGTGSGGGSDTGSGGGTGSGTGNSGAQGGPGSGSS